MRILLRLLGVVLLLGGIGLIVILFEPGPGEVADWMGDNCAHQKNRPGEACNILDVLEISATAPFLILIGFVLTLAMRPERKEPITLDFSRLGRGGGGS